MAEEDKQKELALAQEALQKSFIYLAGNLGVSDPSGEYQIIDSMKDELGMRHFRFQQVYNGLRIFGEHLIVHITKEGEVRDTTGKYRGSVVGMNTEPKLEAGEAIEISRKDFGVEPDEEFSAELLIYPLHESTNNHLAFLVTMPLMQNSLPMRLRYFIDANTGEILLRYNDQPVTGEATSTRGLANRLKGQ
jgi:bacillolysin